MSEHLSKKQKHILKNKGTEAPFTGALLDNKREGMYICADCGAELFSSVTKFESGSGWPSFFASHGDAVRLEQDTSHGMLRTEVICKNCGGHLGHVFEDGPQPTGQRFCINSCALNFKDNDTDELLRGDE